MAATSQQLNFKIKSSLSIIKPLPRAGVLCFMMCFLISSCTSFIIPINSSKKNSLASGYKLMSSNDFEDHYSELKKSFLNNPEIKSIQLDSATIGYAQSLMEDILLNNEIIFKKLKSAKVTILNTETPLHFSLPKGEIFLSKGLITKYLKNESMLASVLTFELVKSEKLLYPKQTVVPIGYIPLEKLLLLNRLNLEEQMEVHKWAHHIIVRSGFDGEYYLSWLQAQNRNTADFILQVGDPNQITREEALFKAFLIKTTQEDKVVTRKNSSKSFYTFINRIRDVL
jgi:hypothetical protein